MRLTLRITHTLFAALLLLLPASLAAQEYSTKPLAIPVAFARNPLPQTATGFFAWMNAPHPDGLPPQQVVLEQVYALIGASVKHRFQTERATALPVGDTTLAHLFDLGAGLGAFGASKVALALGRTGGRGEPAAVPSEFDLSFEAPLFVLASNTGRWRVRFPYYFMVGMIARQQLNDGAVTNIVGLSTLTAADSGAQSGASQASFLLLSTESDDLARMAATWLTRFGISPNDTIARLVPEATRSYQTYSARDGLWKEMSVFRIPSGSLIVFYSGLPGTYQANRPHYLDLLKSLQVR